MSVAVVLRVSGADDFNFVHLLEHPALHTTGHDRAATFDVEHVFDAHQERLVHFARRVRDETIQRVEESVIAFSPSGVPAIAAVAEPRMMGSCRRGNHTS